MKTDKGSVFKVGVSPPADHHKTSCVLLLISVLAWFVTPATGFGAPAFPLRVSSNGRYLVDQNNGPFWLMTGSPWSLMVALTTNEVQTYLDDRQAKGFNGVLVNLVEHKYVGYANPYAAPNNRYHQAPFFKTNDFTTTNEAYFAHCDYVVDECARRGIVLLLNPMYLSQPGSSEGWRAEVLANGTNRCRAYGRFLGRRYRDKPNIIWTMVGDDMARDCADEINAIVAGIKDYDSNHIFTVHPGWDVSGRGDPAGFTWVDLNTVYTWYGDIVGQTEKAWTEIPPMPVFLIEYRYEDGGATLLEIRQYHYGSYLSGGIAGSHFGNGRVWGFFSGWQTHLTTTGTDQIGYLQNLFLSRQWWLLKPDINHAVLIGGYTSGTNRVTASLTSDRSTLIAYAPRQMTFTISMASLAGSNAKAWWYDPRTGHATLEGTHPASGTREFTPPTADDWVLVIDDASVSFPPPGTLRQPPAPPTDLRVVAP